MDSLSTFDPSGKDFGRLDRRPRALDAEPVVQGQPQRLQADRRVRRSRQVGLSLGGDIIPDLQLVDRLLHLVEVHEAVPHTAILRLFQVHAVTEGTDAQAQVSVRLEEDGRIATGQAADTDTLTASAKAYVNALNNLFARKEKSAPDAIASGF